MISKETMQGYRLSPQQRQIWQQLQASRTLHPARCVLRVDGEITAPALAAALDVVVRRHEILRTRFACLPGMAAPLQVVEESVAVEIEVRRPESVDASEAAMADLLLAPLESLPSLADFPPLRAVLVTLSPVRHLLSLTLPGLCADASTLQNLVGELAAVLGGTDAGGGAEADSAVLQYADVSQWLNELLEAEGRELGQAYWRQQAAGAAARLDAVRTEERFSLETRAILLPADIVRAAKAFAADLPLSVPLLAAWIALLSRLDDAPEVVLGVASGDRSYAELEGVLGPLAKHVPLRFACDPSLPFRDLTRMVAGSLREAASWQRYYVPANPEEASFARCFELQEGPASWAAGDVRLTVVGQRVCFDRFEVKLACAYRCEDLWCEWQYDGCRLERVEVERLAERWRTLLADAIAHPERRLLDLDFLGETERRQLSAWSGSRMNYPRERLLPERIVEQAALAPGAPAVECEGRRLRYAELNAQANRVAHRLMALGVGPETRVGLCATRSPDLVVGLLGILKAGAAYVPLDPGYPMERLAYMLEDSGTEVLLAVRDVKNRLPASPVRVLWLDDPKEWARSRPEEPAVALYPAQIAYLIYTSGSTGQPKGVAVSHANLLHSTAARWEHYRERVKGFLVVSSLSFDSSVAGLFWTLSQGGMVCLPAEGGQRDASALAVRIGRGGITHLLCLPSLYAVLLESADRLKALRATIVAGESVPPDLPARHRELLPGTSFYNEYGPTEATVWSTAWEAPATWAERATVPIGRPIANVGVWLLDGAGRPAPIGMTGEIYIGGGGVARGYWGRPALTAERFLPDGLSGDAGERLYRTGDRGRWSDDGELSFLGRADKQVKLRGYRIELGEVEAVLRSHACVGEAVAVLRDESVRGPRLIGYWSRGGRSAEGSPGSIEAELREWLGQKLPEHMVPSALVEVTVWPRTPNGKLDERALPAPEAGGPKGASAQARSLVEEVVAAVWADVLGMEQEPGRDDNFFDLGGHSLLATRVVSRLRAALEVELTLPMFFEARTVAKLAARIAGLRPGALQTLPLVAGVRPDPLPLSYSQQRLWFMDQLHPGSSLYNTAAAVRLEGDLSVEALEGALLAMVVRHEALRTRFPVRDGKPVQEVLTKVEQAAVLDQLDLAAWAAEDRAAEALRRISAASRQPFDLAWGPLERAFLVRLAPQDHILLITMHHVISDAWSVEILVRELTTLYKAFREGQPSPLPPLPVQYADYACWQRAWLQGEVLEAYLRYWRQQLAGAPELLELPTDRARPAVERFQGAKYGFALPGSLVAAVHGLARRVEGTDFMLLLAVFQILLHRYTDQEDLSVGTPIANRDQLAVENVIGCFTNTLVIRSDLGGTPTVLGFLNRVRKTTLEAYEYQALPFDLLVEELQPERSLSHTPLFQVMLVWQKQGALRAEMPGLKVMPFAKEISTSKFDLTLYLTEAGGDLQGAIEYNSDLFDTSTVARMAGHLGNLLAAAVGPEALAGPVDDLELLDPSERTQVLLQWNETATPYPRDASIDELFAARAAACPDAVALVVPGGTGRQISYGELDRWTDLLAQRLTSLGVGPEVAVGIFLDRSASLVVVALAILKAGGAYVPLDPGYPQERLSLILADTGAPVLVTEARLLAALPEHSAEVVFLDAATGSMELASGEAWGPGIAPAGFASADQLAYIMYTSGSGGVPKGVAVPHRGVVRLVQGSSVVDLGADQVFLQLTSPSFDVSTLEIWGALLNGGRLVFPPSGLVSLDEVGELLATTGVTTLWLSAGLFHQAVETHLDHLASVRQLIAGGDVLSVPHVLRALDGLPATTRLINGYGPTENTTFTTYHPVADRGQVGTTVPLGRPIANTRVYLLDAAGRPVPVGVVGELATGGDGLARGYLNRPELTAEKFVPAALAGAAEAPGARLYRTGDMARWMADGRIELLGRRDGQVKIRGFRVEVGEVEAVLAAHPAVREVAVVVYVAAASPGGGLVADDKRLAAYLVPREAKAPAPEELRTYLRGHLPDYMVPAAFHFLAELPLNSSGKVDRRALALTASTETRRPDGEPGLSPRDAVELELVRIWEDLLGVWPIGVRDDFFSLGGHSLLVPRLMSRLRARFNRELPLSLLFQTRTIEALAGVVRRGVGDEPRRVLVEIQPHGGHRPLFCVHPIGGEVLCYLDLARSLGPELPVFGLQSPGQEAGSPGRLEEMAARYLAEIRAAQPEGPYRLAGWSMGGVVAFEMANQLAAAGERVELLAMIDVPMPPNGSRENLEPMAQIALFARDLWGLAGRQEAINLAAGEHSASLGAEDLLHEVFVEARNAGLVPSDLDFAIVQRLFEAFSHNLQALGRYRAGAYGGAALLVRSTASLTYAGADDCLGWDALVRGGISLAFVPGDHYTIVRRPAAEELARALLRALSQYGA